MWSLSQSELQDADRPLRTYSLSHPLVTTHCCLLLHVCLAHHKSLTHTLSPPPVSVCLAGSGSGTTSGEASSHPSAKDWTVRGRVCKAEVKREGLCSDLVLAGSGHPCRLRCLRRTTGPPQLQTNFTGNTSPNYFYRNTTNTIIT